MREFAEIVAAGCLTGLVCLNLGDLALARLRVRLTRPESWFFSFLLGAALLSLVLFGLCSLHIVYWPLLAALAGVAIAARYRIRAWMPPPEPAAAPLPRSWFAVFWGVYAVFGVYYLAAALSPETSPDGVAYHLGFVRRYYEHHGFITVTTNMFANFPFAVEMLFLFAYAFGRHSAAALVHLLFLLVLPLGMIAYAKREGQPAAGVVGALLVFVTPLMGRDAASAYNDVALAAVLFGSFFALQLWWKRQERGLLWVAAALAGFGCAIKYTALPVLLYALGVVCYVHIRNRRRMFADLALVCAVAGVMMVPWLAKNALVTGNPVYPLMNQVFPSPYFYEYVEKDLQASLAHWNGVTLWEIPAEVTMRGFKLSGLIGPVFLLAPLALLALRWRAGRQLLLVCGVCLLTYFSNIGTRFLLPCLPFLSLGLGLVFTSVPGLGLAMLAAHVVLSWPGIVPKYCDPYAWRLGELEWRAALHLTPESEYLSQNQGDYRMGQELNRRVPAAERVYSTSFGQLAYHDREVVNSFGSALGKRTFDMYMSAMIPDQMPTWSRRVTFARTSARRIRMVAMGSAGSAWQIHEMRLYDGTQELARSDRWKLSSSANPWELPLAFDNSAASRWSAGRAVEPGLFVEVELPEPAHLDQVELLVGPSQADVPVEVRVEQDGRWIVPPAREVAGRIEASPLYRRMVMREIHANGVGWLVLRNEDYGAVDVLDHPEVWGVTHVAAVDGYHLLRIEP